MVKWKVEGMDCSNCALTIRKYLEKEGMSDIKVNFATGDLSFEMNGQSKKEELITGISQLGYHVAGPGLVAETRRPFLSTHSHRFLFCLPFTAVLMLHMIPGLTIHWLMDPWVQLGICIPVYIVGMQFFGRSAWKSLRNGLPNMNVLIAIGATAAFVYSLYGALTQPGAHYLFYETTCTIITLVFLGNYLEEASVRSTQTALNKLMRSQKIMAHMIAYDDKHNEQIFPVESTQLHVGDLVLIKTGEQVPIDCKILWGEAHINEAIITGESAPVLRMGKDKLIGGSVVEQGTVKAQVTAVGDDTVLAGIINMVKQAQGEKPPVQKLADKISAIFVPVVLGIAGLTLIINWIILSDFAPALMRSIAVLVIACPCAMGLATPAAIAVGLGRGARNGILFRNAGSLELFKDIRQAVFDKTGTLTTGNFTIVDWEVTDVDVSTDIFRRTVYAMEKYSSHPVAKVLVQDWKTREDVLWKSIEEVKGVGMHAHDMEGNEWWAGSYKLATTLTKDDTHSIYVTRNNKLAGWIDVKDEPRDEAKGVIAYLHSQGIKTIMLSGDKYENCKPLADQLGIEMVFAEQSPEQKMEKVAALSRETPTMMIGDGINDAPALAKATVGISLSEASQLAMQSAQVVLMNNGLKKLPRALGLGKHTYITIKQNLFWAFAYNIVAIPVAALGLLTPTFGALVMGLSDVVLAINSVRLFVKKVE